MKNNNNEIMKSIKKKQSLHNNDKQAYIFTNFANMKFLPEIAIKSNGQIKITKQKDKNGHASKNQFTNNGLKRLDSQISEKNRSQIQKKDSMLLMNNNSNTILEQQKPIKITHLHKLTNDHFLIGNQYQLDIMNLNGIVQDYIDSQFVFSVCLPEQTKGIKRKILLVAVDIKQSVFVLITDMKEIIPYEYGLRKNSQKVFKKLERYVIKEFVEGDRDNNNKYKKMNGNNVKKGGQNSGSLNKRTINIQEFLTKTNVFELNQIKAIPRFAQFYKDGQLLVFFQQFFDVYLVQGGKTQLKKRQKYPLIPGHNLKLFQVPLFIQHKFTIFFSQQNPHQNFFSLWCLQVQFLQLGIKVHQTLKIYDLQLMYKPSIQISNYSNNIYLFNLGFEILAIKGGYVIDSANVNIQSQQTQLVYIGERRLVHLCKKRVDLYGFVVNQSNPPKINVGSLDSIIFKEEVPQNYQFFEVLEMINGNLVFFYQLREEENVLIGQTRYKFCITQKIQYQTKINLIIPSQITQVISTQTIQQKCDILRKMGLSNKQIYLRLWNQSKKQRISDFRLLISTDHYQTIKQQIQKKLRKISMSYRQLHNLQKVCCQMLNNKVKSANFKVEHFKNYLASNFLIKKYEVYYEFSKINKKYGKNHNQNQKDAQNAGMNTTVLSRTQKIHETSVQSSRPRQGINDDKIKINIQDYHKYSKADIKSFLIEYVSQYCLSYKQEYVIKIRILLKKFKFSLRIDYMGLIKDFIKVSHHNFIALLKAIPQILPYKPPESMAQENIQQDPELFQGIWGDITSQDWQKNLYKQKILTVYNKQILQQTFPSDIWYKRYWNTLHDCVFLSKQQIIEIHNYNKSDQIFYLVIGEIYKKYENIDDTNKIKQLIQYIQTHYSQIPEHLHKKIGLYKYLFDYFQIKKFPTLSQNQQVDISTFQSFLKLKDYNLFKLIFTYQKTYKNIIFDQIKPLYKQIFNNSQQIFNESLLNYFKSQLSQISDIKYLLNRMNNKKKQFHLQNQEIYLVLVKAIQYKIKIGSDNDISIDEVLIYIENIPLTKNHEIINQLNVIHMINSQVEKLKEMRINMSLKEIIDQPDLVLSLIIEYEIKKANIAQSKDIKEIKNKTYLILAQAESMNSNIYNKQEMNRTFFIYLIKFLELEEMIDYVKLLLEDDLLGKYCTIDESLIQDIVKMAYYSKLQKDSVYKNNQVYIKKLIEILPQDNNTRMYVQSQIDLAVYLSNLMAVSVNWVKHPIAKDLITIFDIENYVHYIPAQKLVDINVRFIFEKALILQEIGSEFTISNIIMDDVYELVILKLIECNMLRQAIRKTKQFFEQIQKDKAQNTEQNSKIVRESSHLFLFPALILQKIFKQFCQENKQLMSLYSRYAYKDPKSLLMLIENLMTHKYSSQEQKNLILKQMEVLQNSEKVGKPASTANTKNVKLPSIMSTYSVVNPVLSQQYIQLVQDKQSQQKHSTNAQNPHHLSAQHRQYSKNLDLILTYILRKYTKSRDQFKTYEFHLIFLLLCNDPYLLIKYIFLQRYSLNFKNFRCFLSYLIRQEIFDSLKLLEFGKRMFKMLHVSINEEVPIQEIINEYKRITLTNLLEIQRIKVLQDQMDRKISKSLERFKNKLKIMRNENNNKGEKNICSIQQAKKKISKMVEMIKKKSISQNIQPYNFHDSDDDAQNKEMEVKKEDIYRKKSEKSIVFDASITKNLLMSKRFGVQPGNLLVSMENANGKNMFFSANFGIKGMQLNSLMRSKKLIDLQKSKDKLTQQKSIGPSILTVDNNSPDKNRFFNSNNSRPQNQMNSQKKPKRKFAISKVQSQYVNLDDFLRFQSLVKSVQKQPTSKGSQIQSINQLDIQKEYREFQSKNVPSKTSSINLRHLTNMNSKPLKKFSDPPSYLKNQIQPQNQQQQGYYLKTDKKFNKIRKISQQIQDQMSQYPSQSNLVQKFSQKSQQKSTPNSQHPSNNQQSIIQIQQPNQNQNQYQLNDGQNPMTKNFIDQIFINQITQQIIKMVSQAQMTHINLVQKIDIKSEILQKQKDKPHFNQIIKIVIEKLYLHESKSILHILSIIKAISQKYKKECTIINKKYMEIYIKMAELQIKFNLKFPFRKVFVPTGIYLDKTSSEELFTFLAPHIQSYLTEQNVLKLSKIISLGFKKSEIELEIYLILLRKYIKGISFIKKKIETNNYINLLRKKQDLEIYHGELEKMECFLEKVSSNIFIQKEKDILELISWCVDREDESKEGSNVNSRNIAASQKSNNSLSSDHKLVREFNKEIFLQMIVSSLKKRGQNKISQTLKKKWQKTVLKNNSNKW